MASRHARYELVEDLLAEAARGARRSARGRPAPGSRSPGARGSARRRSAAARRAGRAARDGERRVGASASGAGVRGVGRSCLGGAALSPERAPLHRSRPLARRRSPRARADIAEDVAELVALAAAPRAAGAGARAGPAGPAGPARVGSLAAPAALHQAPQRLGQIALGHQVVGQRLEDLVGSRGRAAAGSRPSAR